MTDSILNSTKKMLGLDESYSAFDMDIIMNINSVFSTLNQIGVGPAAGFEIEDDSATWDRFLGTDPRFNFVKNYMYLKVRLVFDPPGTSYLLTSYKEQVTELESRMSILREELAHPLVEVVPVKTVVVE